MSGEKRNTKDIARRLDFNYIKGSTTLRRWKSRLTIGVLALAGLAVVGFSFAPRTSRTLVSPGPISSPHALFADRCDACHAAAFSRIPDSACQKCHDGPAHPAKAFDQARLNSTPACVECHVEHRGDIALAKVSDGNCTDCHRNLDAHAAGVKLKSVDITAFRPGDHPEFSPASELDLRPLKLNHAIHMPADAKVVQKIKLPMKCADCHVTDPNSATGDLIPVTFERNCKPCHARELEFDVYQVLKTSVPAPHAKDPRTIHEFIVGTYQNLLAADPGIVKRPLGNDIAPQRDRAAWLNKVVSDSEAYLFGRSAEPSSRAGKCSYCHELAGWNGGLPVIAKVNSIQGRFEKDKPESEPWFERAEFSHRAHRAVECESCHTSARTSRKTSDVLIPAMKTCLPCHSDARAGLDHCSECHLYHNKSRERDERRPTDQIVSELTVR